MKGAILLRKSIRNQYFTVWNRPARAPKQDSFAREYSPLPRPHLHHRGNLLHDDIISQH